MNEKRAAELATTLVSWGFVLFIAGIIIAGFGYLMTGAIIIVTGVALFLIAMLISSTTNIPAPPTPPHRLDDE